MQKFLTQGLALALSMGAWSLQAQITESDNKVGINNTSPDAALDVSASEGTILQLKTNGDWFQPPPEFFGDDPLPVMLFPTMAFQVLGQIPSTVWGGPFGDHYTVFSIKPNGQTQIGAFPANPHELLAVQGDIALYKNVNDWIKLRHSTGSAPELRWRSNGGQGFSIMNHSGQAGLYMAPSGKVGLGTTDLSEPYDQNYQVFLQGGTLVREGNSTHSLYVEGSSVSRSIQVQAEADWAGGDNKAGLSTDQGQHLFWRSQDGLFKFRSEDNTPLTLHADGKVAAGSSSFDGDYTLRVRGGSVSETLQVQAEGDWAGDNNIVGLSNADGRHLFWNSSDGLMQFRSGNNNPLSLHADGKVGINTTHFVGNHSLYVEGSIIIEEGFVKLKGTWPDYVFSSSYYLMPLHEVGAFIEDHGRLPGMPSAAQVAEEGIALGETQRLLTEKVEELTLHLIELQKQLELLKETRND